MSGFPHIASPLFIHTTAYCTPLALLMCVFRSLGMRACAAWRASRHATQIMEQHAFAASHGASSPRCVAPSHPRGLPLHLPSVFLSQCAGSLHLAALFSSCCCCRLTALAFCREPKWSACAVAAVVVDTDLCSTCVCVCVCVCVCCVSALLFRIHSHFHLQRAAILLFWHVYVSVSAYECAG